MRQIWASIFLVMIFASGSWAAEGPADLVKNYVQLVLAGDTENVVTLWSPEYLAACSRLDINYAESSASFDLASPLHTYLKELRRGKLRLQVGAADIDGEGFVVPVQLVGGPAAPPFHYAVVPVGDDWKLAGRIWAAGRTWPRFESEFVAYHCQDEKLLTAPARQALDRYVADTAALLAVSPERLDDLRRHKILYYLADEETVARLTGYPTKGMAELATGSVISSHFPHFHEVAHLLLNYALEEAPLLPLPLLQEGTACLLGGRWGRAPRVIQYMGWVNHSMGLVELKDILTRDGFYAAASGPDATYAAGSVLCDLIVTEAGWPGLLELQTSLALSGEPRDAAAIAGEIARVCGWETDTPLALLQEKYEAWLPRFRRGGVEPGADAGQLTGTEVLIREVDDAFEFVVPGGDEPVAVLPVSPSVGEKESHSSLFSEVLRGHTYAGQPVGLRCSSSSISVYDFAANRLVGVWVGDFSGEPQGAGSGAGQIVFRVMRGVLPDSLLSDVKWELAQP